jgi:hypothetical protein
LSSAHYTTSTVQECTGEGLNLSYDTPSWANQADNLYYLGSPVSLSATSQLEHTSPTDQDMIDFLTEALPDIWMPESIPQFGSLATSMLLGDCGQDTFQAPDASGNTGSSGVAENYSNEQGASSITVAHPEAPQLGEITDRQEKSPLDVPRTVVDNL